MKCVLRRVTVPISLTGGSRLRKFIHHPVVLATVHEDHSGRAAVNPRPAHGEERDAELVTTGVSCPTNDLECAITADGKELFKSLWSLRMAKAVAEQNCSGFQIIRLPSMQETI